MRHLAWRAGDVKEVVALDDYTLKYELNAPYSELLYQLAQSFGTVVDKENVEALGADFERTPIGTGPFMFEEYQPQQYVKADLFGAQFIDAKTEASIRIEIKYLGSKVAGYQLSTIEFHNWDS